MFFFRRIKTAKTSNADDAAEHQPTKLAIGVEGGFSAGPETQFDFEDSYRVYLAPEQKFLQVDSNELPEIVRQNVRHVIDAHSPRASSLPLEWDGEKRRETTVQLVQLDNGRKVPPSGWKCERCDLTTNLWVNLSDGAILCGRKFFDGSGGNNHAVDYYRETGYPLAVKLGTITADGRADVFSYTEDDMVEDPKLKEHLAHFGINIENMVKTDKTMAEMEIELNQSYEWKLLTEEGSNLERMYGTGYVGLRNLGNTCYVASVMQALYHIPDVAAKYLAAFASLVSTVDPTSDEIHNNLSFQMAKLFTGLLSEKYSTPEMVEKHMEGISPASFKRCVGKNHREFSTGNQQDVQEFILHLFSLVEKTSRIFGEDFTKDFQFSIQEKIVCSVTQAARYDKRKDNMLSLFVPMDKTINNDEVNAFVELKEKYKSEGKEPDVSEIVIPKVPFSELLTTFIEKQVVENFRSAAANNQLVEGHKYTSILTFPKYLFIHIRRFTITEDWRPAKLEVSIDMPENIDLSVIRALPRPEHETLMPTASQTQASLVFNEEIVSTLMSMGFTSEACKRACFHTNNSGIEAASNWVMEHLDDADLNLPFDPNGGSESAGSNNSSSPALSEESIAIVMSMGFERVQAINALKNTDGNVERAIDWIFSHLEESMTPEAPTEAELPANQGATGTNNECDQIDMGSSKYKLLSFISHIGPSASCGHYVAHVKINDKWILFNDEKVAVSSKLPKDLGYIYVYERM